MYVEPARCAHCGGRIGPHERVYAQGATGAFYDGDWLMLKPKQRPPRLWHAACRESLPTQLHPPVPAQHEPVATDPESNVVPLAGRNQTVRRLHEANGTDGAAPDRSAADSWF